MARYFLFKVRDTQRPRRNYDEASDELKDMLFVALCIVGAIIAGIVYLIIQLVIWWKITLPIAAGAALVGVAVFAFRKHRIQAAKSRTQQINTPL